MIWMDVDTALPELPVNLLALIDDTDFKTREESVTFDQAGLDLLWNFVTTAGLFSQVAVTPTDTAGDYDWINQGNGMYTIEMPLSGGASMNNDSEGYGWFTGFATGILPWVGPTIGFRAAGLNNVLIDAAYSATRGLSGTALPDAAADAANGLPISDAGGLDMDDLPLTAEFEARTIVAASYFDPAADTVASVTLVGTTTTNTDMVGTDNGATAADLLDKLGAVDEAAAAGDPSATESVMQYVKQIVNILAGAAGVVAYPSGTGPANGVSLAEVISAIHALVTQMNLGIVVSTTKAGTLSTTQSSTNLAQGSDQLIGRIITFTSGVLKDEASDITDFENTNGVLTYTAMTAAAGAGDAFKIT